MNKVLKNIFILLILLLIPINLQSIKAESKYNIYLFYGDKCPHCASEEEFLDKYLEDHKDVELVKYEVWNSSENRELLVKVQNELNNHTSGVPYLVVGDEVIIGYLDGITDTTIENVIDEYISSKKPYDVMNEINNVNNKKPKKKDKKEANNEFNLPILGKINAKTVSLPLISIILGFVDGFNPCAMWILIFLLTLLINNKDKKKMIILGLAFILCSGITYLFFMLTWLNLTTFLNKLSIIKIIISVIAFIAGFINLSSFYKETRKNAGCEVVKPNKRKKIINTLQSIVNEKKFIIALCGIIVLSFSVNIIEMMCSVGLPLIFTQILSMNDLSLMEYCIYLFLYILFFLIDDIIIFIIAVISFKITGISTKLSKYSHLVSGILLLLIGIIMLVKPSLLMFNF